jgi:hypothetical protein
VYCFRRIERRPLSSECVPRVDAHAEVCSACEPGKRTPHAAVVPKVTRERSAVNATNLSALESRNAVSRAAASPIYLGESGRLLDAVACRVEVSDQEVCRSNRGHLWCRATDAPSPRSASQAATLRHGRTSRERDRRSRALCVTSGASGVLRVPLLARSSPGEIVTALYDFLDRTLGR